MANISNIDDGFSLKNNSEVGGLAYFLIHISDYLPYVVLASFGAVVGILGNLIIMLTIILNRELHSPTYMLMFNLSITDILVSGFVNSTSIWSLFIGNTYFANRPSICVFIAMVCSLGCNGSLVNLVFLAVNRYINICHNSLYKKLFTNKLTLFYCLVPWILAFLNTLPNLTGSYQIYIIYLLVNASIINMSLKKGWGNFTYDRDTLNCLWNRLASLSYNMFLIILSIIVPCASIFFFYARIFYFSCKSGQKSNSSNANKSIRLAKGLFASFMLYTICWMPYGLVVLINFYDQFPRSVMIYSMVLGHLNSSLNPVIYFYFNSAFKRGCLNLLNKVYCCVPFRNNRITTTGNSSSANKLANIQSRTLNKI